MLRQEVTGELRRVPHHETVASRAPRNYIVRGRIVNHVIGFDKERRRRVRVGHRRRRRNAFLLLSGGFLSSFHSRVRARGRRKREMAMKPYVRFTSQRSTERYQRSERERWRVGGKRSWIGHGRKTVAPCLVGSITRHRLDPNQRLLNNYYFLTKILLTN